MTLQYFIIGVVILACLVYAGRRVYVVIRSAGDKCYGCSGCAIHDMMQQKLKKQSKRPTCYKKA